MVGKNVKLYDMVLQFLRTLFLRTRNVHYCTLRAELLMSLHELDVGDICSVDPCHKVVASPPPPSTPAPPAAAVCQPLCHFCRPGSGAGGLCRAPESEPAALHLPGVPALCLPLLQLGQAPWPLLDACSGCMWDVPGQWPSSAPESLGAACVLCSGGEGGCVSSLSPAWMLCTLT